MTTIHTQGRITVRENGDPNSYAILDDRGYWLLSLLHNGQQVTSTQRENLRRLVACWNACEDEDTSMLEAIVNDGTTVRARHDDALRLKETYQRELCSMERQLDELLAALKLARKSLEVANNTPDGPIRDTIWSTLLPKHCLTSWMRRLKKRKAVQHEY